MHPDDTTRRLLFGASGTTAPPGRQDASLTQLPGAPPPPHAAAATASSLVSAEEEAEAALRYLEAEWSMRMEAPLSALAGLEETLTSAIDDAARSLPYPPPPEPRQEL